MAMFKWTVAFEIDERWVADGFVLTDQRALDMLSSELPNAFFGTELKAKVIEAPATVDLAKAQGYSNIRKGVSEINELIKNEKGI